MKRAQRFTAAVVPVLCAATLAASPAAAEAGSIAGTVTDDSIGHTPLAGIRVCSFEPQGASEELCTTTDAGGDYALAGLNAGQYVVSFRAQPGQNLVTQYYDGKTTFVEADPVVVGGGPVAGIDAEMHEGGTIAGTATAAGSGTPIAGLSVCADANGGLYSGCTVTSASGQYSIAGLPADSEYHVEFTAGPSLNYLSQSYQGKEGLDEWDPVEVTVGATATGIDAVMNPGAQISGHVSEAGTGAPVGGIEVCALDPAETPRAEEFEQCAFTDGAGDYTIRSLRAGTFVVLFSRARGFIDADGYAPQYYDGVGTEAEATRITLTPPATRSGVDAALINTTPQGPHVIVTVVQRPQCVVPRLLGKRLSVARSQLVAAHCRLGKVTRHAAPRRQRGRVLRQSPRPRTVMPKNARVAVVVGVLRGRQ